MTINKFKTAMEADGIYCKEQIIADGKVHNFPSPKKGKGNAGWYVLKQFSNGCFYGHYGDFYQGISFEFKNGKTNELSQEEKDTIKREIEKAGKERLAQWEKTSEQAVEKLEHLSSKGFSEYLKKKQVNNYNILFDNINTIYIPMRDVDGKIWSYQKIFLNGDKRFLTGGKKQGNFHVIGEYPAEKIILCEGYATGASVHEATGITTIVCFDASNMVAVSKVINAKEIIIAGDNDKAGIKSAKATNYKYLLPEQEGYDFNDVHVNLGLQAVKDYFVEPQQNEITYPHGLVGDIARWITDNSVSPQPIISISLALSLVGAIKSHKVRSDTDLRTNLYCMSLALSGAGKDSPRKLVEQIIINKRLTNNKGNRNLFGLLVGEPTGSSALYEALKKNDGKGLSLSDEWGQMLGRITNKNSGTTQSEAIDCLLKLFSASNTVLIGKQFANSANRERIDLYQPCFNFNGITISTNMYSNLSSTAVLDGFLNRFLVFESKIRPRKKKKKDMIFSDIPENVIQNIERILDMPFNVKTGANVCLDYNEIEIIPKTVEFSEQAQEILDNYEDEIYEKMLEMDKQNNPFVALYARVIEHTIKVALIVCDDTIINRNDLEWAINTVKICTENLIDGCRHNISDNFLEAENKNVLRIIKEHRTITKNELVRKTQSLNRKRRDEILDDLLEGNRITMIKNKKKNSDKPITHFKYLK